MSKTTIINIIFIIYNICVAGFACCILIGMKRDRDKDKADQVKRALTGRQETRDELLEAMLYAMKKL